MPASWLTFLFALAGKRLFHAIKGFAFPLHGYISVDLVFPGQFSRLAIDCVPQPLPRCFCALLNTASFNPDDRLPTTRDDTLTHCPKV